MKSWAVLLMFGGAACSPKQESPSLALGETTEVEAAVDQAQEGCVSECIDSMCLLCPLCQGKIYYFCPTTLMNKACKIRELA